MSSGFFDHSAIWSRTKIWRRNRSSEVWASSISLSMREPGSEVHQPGEPAAFAAGDRDRVRACGTVPPATDVAGSPIADLLVRHVGKHQVRQRLFQAGPALLRRLCLMQINVAEFLELLQ